jgi:hypothetical protein
LPRPRPATERGERRARFSIGAGHAWPLAIVIGLSIVVAANAAFIYVALSHPDPVAPSYAREQR